MKRSWLLPILPLTVVCPPIEVSGLLWLLADAPPPEKITKSYRLNEPAAAGRAIAMTIATVNNTRANPTFIVRSRYQR